MNYDLIVIGSGPGGYVAAIRASQLGMKVGVVEREHLGGICLNWGCIPTKALLKSAQVFEYAQHAADYGVKIEGTPKPDFTKIVERSRGVADGMSKGIQFLFKKNKIDTIWGSGKLIKNNTVEVTDKDGKKTDEWHSDEGQKILSEKGKQAEPLLPALIYLQLIFAKSIDSQGGTVFKTAVALPQKTKGKQ